MNVRLTVIALFATMLLASRAAAQGTAAWSAGYPKTGNNNGGILVKGTTTPDCGWAIGATGAVVVWPKNGGLIRTYNVTVNTTTGNWGESEVGVGDLTSGSQYNVVVQINLTKCGTTKVVATPPGLATAK
jgi:hypothetical protein